MVVIEKNPKSCFVICPLGKDESDTRKRSDTLLNHIIKPALNDLNYSIVRADQYNKTGTITAQIIQLLQSSDLVIADLTERNANVFYELAIRDTIGKHAILLKSDEVEPPFDIASLRYIKYSTTDVSKIDRTRKEIRESAIKIDKDGKIADNPVTMAISYQQLRQSEDPLQNAIVNIGDRMARIESLIEGQGRGNKSEMVSDYPDWTKFEDAESGVWEISKTEKGEKVTVRGHKDDTYTIMIESKDGVGKMLTRRLKSDFNLDKLKSARITRHRDTLEEIIKTMFGT